MQNDNAELKINKIQTPVIASPEVSGRSNSKDELWIFPPKEDPPLEENYEFRINFEWLKSETF